jgi:hypothetical protein
VINALSRSQLREEISRAFTARIASEFSHTDAGLIDDASTYFRASSLTSSDQRAWAAGTPSSRLTFFRLMPTFLTAHGLTAHGYRVDRGFGRCVDLTANSRVTRCMITLLVYVALQLGSVVLGIAISHSCCRAVFLRVYGL